MTKTGPDTEHDPLIVAQQMEVAREVMERRREAMMALADRIMDEDSEILAALAKS